MDSVFRINKREREPAFIISLSFAIILIAIMVLSDAEMLRMGHDCKEAIWLDFLEVLGFLWLIAALFWAIVGGVRVFAKDDRILFGNLTVSTPGHISNFIPSVSIILMVITFILILFDFNFVWYAFGLMIILTLLIILQAIIENKSKLGNIIFLAMNIIIPSGLAILLFYIWMFYQFGCFG